MSGFKVSCFSYSKASYWSLGARDLQPLNNIQNCSPSEDTTLSVQLLIPTEMMLAVCRMKSRASCHRALDSYLAVGFVISCDVYKESWEDSLDHFSFTNQ